MNLPSIDSIFLDTSVLYGDYRLRSGDLLHLTRVCRISNLEIIVPAVVLTDLIAHYQFDFEKVISQTHKAIQGLDRYIFKGYTPKFNLKDRELLKNYESWLYKRVKNLGILILNYPKTSHEEIVRRSAMRRKPFKDHDRGYKDTLIWESILEYLRDTSNKSYLLSVDQDFSDNMMLHQDLIDDLQDHNIDINRVSLFKGFESLFDHLYKTYDILSRLEEEERADWVSISKNQLKDLISFKDVFSQEKNAIERMILINPHLFTASPQVERLVSLSDEVNLQNVEFNMSYSGSGVWKLDGHALINVPAEYRNLLNEQIQPFPRCVILNLDIKFIIYYDYPNQTITDVMIKHVSNKPNKW